MLFVNYYYYPSIHTLHFGIIDEHVHVAEITGLPAYEYQHVFSIAYSELCSASLPFSINLDTQHI